MTLQVDVATNGLRVALSRDRVADLARWVLRKENVQKAQLSVTFLDARAMASLNRRHLGHAGPTDVIAFEFAPPHPNAPVAGDIYICPAIARENALAHGCGRNLPGWSCTARFTCWGMTIPKAPSALRLRCGSARRSSLRDG